MPMANGLASLRLRANLFQYVKNIVPEPIAPFLEWYLVSYIMPCYYLVLALDRKCDIALKDNMLICT